MREIKFRGKSTINNEWVYGNFANLRGHHCIISPFEDVKNINAQYIYAKTLGQYTGLKDKNGVEIYENDEAKKDLFVYWDEYECGWNLRDKETNNEYRITDIMGLEVIGNIHIGGDII